MTQTPPDDRPSDPPDPIRPEREPGPRIGERARAEQAARAEREAAALRANLRRRHEQRRARENGAG